MSDLKKTLTVIKQGGNYLLDTGGYNTHLAIDGKQFAKTSRLTINYEPKKIELGTDKNEPDFWMRVIDGKEERLDNEDYQFMRNDLEIECKDEDGNYISLEHEYKWRKAMLGWTCTRKEWVEWEAFEFQILHLPETNNPTITGYLAEKDYDNPLVIYIRNKKHIVVDAFNRLGIDIMAAKKHSGYDGIPQTLTRDTTWGNDDLYTVKYDKHRIVEHDDFKRPAERITLKKAEELYEEDVQQVISKYKKAYAIVNAEVNEQNGQALAEALESIERYTRALPVYAKSHNDKDALLRKIVEAKKYLGVN